MALCTSSGGIAGSTGSSSTFASATPVVAAGGGGGTPATTCSEYIPAESGPGTCLPPTGGTPPGGGGEANQTWRRGDPGAPIPGQTITVTNNGSVTATWK